MRKLGSVLVGLILLIVTSCTPNIISDEKISEDFVKSQGYTIITRIGEIQKYTLEEGIHVLMLMLLVHVVL